MLKWILRLATAKKIWDWWKERQTKKNARREAARQEHRSEDYWG